MNNLCFGADKYFIYSDCSYWVSLQHAPILFFVILFIAVCHSDINGLKKKKKLDSLPWRASKVRREMLLYIFSKIPWGHRTQGGELNPSASSEYITHYLVTMQHSWMLQEEDLTSFTCSGSRQGIFSCSKATRRTTHAGFWCQFECFLIIILSE